MPRPRVLDAGEKRRFIGGVRRLRIERDLGERQAQRSGLLVQQRAAHAMDADAIVLACDTRHETYNLDMRIRGERGESERAILATAPTEKNLQRSAFGSVNVNLAPPPGELST